MTKLLLYLFSHKLHWCHCKTFKCCIQHSFILSIYIHFTSFHLFILSIYIYFYKFSICIGVFINFNTSSFQRLPAYVSSSSWETIIWLWVLMLVFGENNQIIIIKRQLERYIRVDVAQYHRHDYEMTIGGIGGVAIKGYWWMWSRRIEIICFWSLQCTDATKWITYSVQCFTFFV